MGCRRERYTGAHVIQQEQPAGRRVSIGNCRGRQSAAKGQLHDRVCHHPSKPSNGSGVEVTGTIVDADTKKPIAGAAFIVLQPGITYDAWDGGQESILTYAVADKRGVFQLPDLIPRGDSYTIVAGAKGYNDNYEDDVAVDDSTPDSVDLNLTLQKP